MSASSGTPRHIAIIMDGNGRWAKERGLPRLEGHRAGAESVREALEACIELGVEYLTLYAFSSENWNRPETEVKALMALLDRFLKERAKDLDRQKVRLRITAHALRSVEHRGGLDKFLLAARDSELSLNARRLKRQIAKRVADVPAEAPAA